MKKIVMLFVCLALAAVLAISAFASPAEEITTAEATTAEPVTAPEPIDDHNDSAILLLMEQIENLRVSIKNIGEDTEETADTMTEAIILWIKQNSALLISVAIVIINFIFRYRVKAENSDLKKRMNTVSKYLTLLFGGTAADGSKVDGKVYDVLTGLDQKVDDLLTEQQEKLAEMTLLIEAAKIAVSDSTEAVASVGKSIEDNALQIKAQTEAIKLQALANKNLIDMTNAPDYQKEIYNAEYAEQEKVLKKLEVKASEAQNENKTINT